MICLQRPEQCCLLQAMLFPVFHPKSSVGLVETLWLADVSKGKLPTKDILERSANLIPVAVAHYEDITCISMFTGGDLLAVCQ